VLDSPSAIPIGGPRSWGPLRRDCGSWRWQLAGTGHFWIEGSLVRRRFARCGPTRPCSIPSPLFCQRLQKARLRCRVSVSTVQKGSMSSTCMLKRQSLPQNSNLPSSLNVITDSFSMALPLLLPLLAALGAGSVRLHERPPNSPHLPCVNARSDGKGGRTRGHLGEMQLGCKADDVVYVLSMTSASVLDPISTVHYIHRCHLACFFHVFILSASPSCGDG